MTTPDETRRISRRKFLHASGALLGTAALAACGSTPTTSNPTTAPAPTTAVAPAEPTTAAAPAEPTATTAPATTSGEPVTLELWTFIAGQADWYKAMAETYKKDVNPSFNLTATVLEYGALHDKLKISLQAGGVGAPDLADIEQGQFGGFLLGDNVGLVDISDRLKPYEDKLVSSRQALYSYQGKTYGIELALTPVAMYYRDDIWKAAGFDPEKIATWDDFITASKALSKGDVRVLPGAYIDTHEVLLRQRGGDWFDKDGAVTLDSQLSIDTMQWIVDLKLKHDIIAPPDDANQTNAKSGKLLAFMAADWGAGFARDGLPELKGKWKGYPLPAWEQGGIRTSSWGGTGNCIISTSKNVEEAWKFQEHSLLSVEGAVTRFQAMKLYPPFIPAMADPRLHVPDEYFSGQDLGKLYGDLAPDVPPQYQSPYRAELRSKLTPLLQDVFDGKTQAADVFKQVSDEIRKVMAEA